MQQFLVTGYALYAVAAVCGLGVLCKWVTRIFYKRLIKEAGNLAMTKNKNLKALKQKIETVYRTNAGMANMSAYLEHQMCDFRFLGVTLTGWGNFSNQMTFLCLLLGGAAAFLSYWYRTDSYYIVLYGAAGILSGLLLLMIDSGVNLGEKREQLLVALEDYMDNSLFFRPGKGRMAVPEEEDEIEEGEGPSPARSAAARRSKRREAVVRAVSERPGRRSFRERIQERRLPEREEDARLAEEKQQDGGQDQENTAALPQAQRADYLKHSLEQIAASRERHKDEQPEENWLKDLNPQEIKLLGDIIKEYLA